MGEPGHGNKRSAHVERPSSAQRAARGPGDGCWRVACQEPLDMQHASIPEWGSADNRMPCPPLPGLDAGPCKERRRPAGRWVHMPPRCSMCATASLWLMPQGHGAWGSRCWCRPPACITVHPSLCNTHINTKTHTLSWLHCCAASISLGTWRGSRYSLVHTSCTTLTHPCARTLPHLPPHTYTPH